MANTPWSQSVLLFLNQNSAVFWNMKWCKITEQRIRAISRVQGDICLWYAVRIPLLCYRLDFTYFGINWLGMLLGFFGFSTPPPPPLASVPGVLLTLYPQKIKTTNVVNLPQVGVLDLAPTHSKHPTWPTTEAQGVNLLHSLRIPSKHKLRWVWFSHCPRSIKLPSTLTDKFYQAFNSSRLIFGVKGRQHERKAWERG